MSYDSFSIDVLIASMKQLRGMELGQHVHDALEGVETGLDEGALRELVEELQHDLEEHIERLERISGVLTAAEKEKPETMSVERRREVAWQSKCDPEEVDSLCEAFERARQILSRMGAGGAVDFRLLLTNLSGLFGKGGEPGEEPNGAVFIVPEMFRKLMRGAKRTEAGKAAGRRELDEFEQLFDLEKTSAPKNRLPKDWKP